MINYFRHEGEFVNAVYQDVNFSDETDKKFHEVYASGKGQYLITGNIKHFPKETNIIIPRGFIEIYNK